MPLGAVWVSLLLPPSLSIYPVPTQEEEERRAAAAGGGEDAVQCCALHARTLSPDSPVSVRPARRALPHRAAVPLRSGQQTCFPSRRYRATIVQRLNMRAWGAGTRHVDRSAVAGGVSPLFLILM